MSTPYTYRDTTLSLWQSAVRQVAGNRQPVKAAAAADPTKNLVAPAPIVEDDLMAPAHAIGMPLSAGQPVPAAVAAPAATAAAVGGVAVVGECAEVAAKFLWAEITGDKASSDLYAAELQYAVCNVAGWAECLTTYLGFKASLGSLPYRPNQNPVFDLPEKATVAIIGDWGTGDDVATNLLQQVATFKPDILIHLGDIYFAGTQSEANNNFLQICRKVLGSDVRLFSLCGNHDMYSGGDGYYWLVDQLGQQASYFCLQNDDWQFLAMDTGYNDNNPITVNTNMTSLVKTDTWSETAWHLEKIAQAGTRRIAMFSHHQLFSPFASVGSLNGQQFPYNPNLLDDFQSVLPKLDIWFWGHEHTLALYDPYLNLVRGRCVGASAVPVFTDQQQYAADESLLSGEITTLPTWEPSAILGSNGTDYNNAFAIMTLKGAQAVVNYYQVPLLKPYSQVPFTDTI